MSGKTIVIVDYGMGNLFNLQRAIASLGFESTITFDSKRIETAGRLLLPGVGAFPKAMEELNKRLLLEPLGQFRSTGRPLLGICLGMQLLFSKSYEFGEHKGLDFIKGKVIPLRRPEPDGNKYKIPQIGWNRIEIPSSRTVGPASKRGLLTGLTTGADYYFVHSFFCCPEDPAVIAAETEYGRDRFCSVAHQENLWGCQFHPERSGELGLAFLKNFINL